MTEELRPLEGERLLNEISRHVYLVALTIGWPKLSYQIADAVVEVKKDGDNGDTKKVEIAEDLRNNPHWQLMPNDWKAKFTTLEGKARRIVSASSASFATKGMSLLPISRAPEIFHILSGMREEFMVHRNGFVTEYATIREEIKTKLKASDETLWNKVKDKLPDEDAIRGRFNMNWAIMPLGGSGLQVPQVDLEDVRNTLQEHHDNLAATLGPESTALEQCRRSMLIVSGLIDQSQETIHHLDDQTATDLVQQARGQVADFGQQVLANMIEEPRRAIAEAVENMMGALADNSRRIRSGTIDQIKRSFELMKGFDFLADETLLTRMQQCEVALENVSVQELNASEETGRRIARYLQGVHEQATSDDAVSHVGRQFCAVRLTPPREPVPA
jgi:hypothetical protein